MAGDEIGAGYGLIARRSSGLVVGYRPVGWQIGERAENFAAHQPVVGHILIVDHQIKEVIG